MRETSLSDESDESEEDMSKSSLFFRQQNRQTQNPMPQRTMAQARAMTIYIHTGTLLHFATTGKSIETERPVFALTTAVSSVPWRPAGTTCMAISGGENVTSDSESSDWTVTTTRMLVTSSCHPEETADHPRVFSDSDAVSGPDDEYDTRTLFVVVAGKVSKYSPPVPGWRSTACESRDVTDGEPDVDGKYDAPVVGTANEYSMASVTRTSHDLPELTTSVALYEVTVPSTCTPTLTSTPTSTNTAPTVTPCTIGLSTKKGNGTLFFTSSHTQHTQRACFLPNIKASVSGWADGWKE